MQSLQEIDVKTFREVIKLLNTANELTLTELSLSIALNGTEQKVLASLTLLNFTSLTSLMLVRFIRSHGQIDFLTQSPVLFQLEKLDLSESSGLRGKVCNLLTHSFSKLNTLILCNCSLIIDDLCSLAKANEDDRLPELRKLDISRNESLAGETCHLFGKSLAWKKLVSLNIDHCGTAMNSELLKLNPHHLVSLQELKCFVCQNSQVPLLINLGNWDNLTTITISTEDENDCCRLLEHLLELVKGKLLPALYSVLIINQYPSLSKAGSPLR